MRLSKSWTRDEYEIAYRGFRRLSPEVVIYPMWGIPNEIVQAADYSYQARDYIVNGWGSERRRQQFYKILYRVLTQSEGIPF